MWRKERVVSTAGWYRLCLLSLFSFIGRNIFYSSSWNISEDKTKIFFRCFQAVVMWWWEAEDDPVIRVSRICPVLWCPPAWLATTPVPPCTPPLSTDTKVRSSALRLETWLCVQVTPDRRDGEEFSTSKLITNNCRVRDLHQRDTTTTTIGESPVQ